MTRLLPLLALLIPVLLPAQVQADTTVGYVDMQKVLEESKVGQQLQEELRKQFDPKGQELAREEHEIAQMREDLQRNGPLMSADQAKKKKQEIDTRIAAYKKQAIAVQQELAKVQHEKGREVLEPAREAVNAIAKKKKIGMVIERSQAGLLYIDEGLDMTGEVIKYMNAHSK